MTTTTAAPVVHDFATVIDSEFASARRELISAKAARDVKDSPANRAAVESALARVDAILDFHLSHPQPGSTRLPQRPADVQRSN